MQFRPELEYRRAFLLLRWQLIILASYLTLFSYLSSDNFNWILGFVVLFSLTNIGLGLLPAQYFENPKVHKALAVVDAGFVGAVMYLLRPPEMPLYIAFWGIFLLVLLHRDFKLVLFSILAVALLFGFFSTADLYDAEVDISLDDFLALALFFLVSVFYVFFAGRMKRDAILSAELMEEKRYAEVMFEITRALSSSLNSQEILFAIVSQLHSLLNAVECSIVRVDAETHRGYIIVKSDDPVPHDVDVDLAQHPELLQAYNLRKIFQAPYPTPHRVIAVPMIAQDTVLGLIHIRAEGAAVGLSESNARFLEIMANTAANALCNAQLFEQVEHRARTDFLTGLPNYRFFQSMLSVELVRAQRHNHPLSLLIIDLDHLKEVNDRFGHPSGDMVIRTIAEAIRMSCREFDFAARYGGEEFTVILPETPLTGAIQVADRIRERIASEHFPGIGGITASIGIANYPVNVLTKEDLIRVADQALYVAKNGGRDRVTYFNYQMVTR